MTLALAGVAVSAAARRVDLGAGADRHAARSTRTGSGRSARSPAATPTVAGQVAPFLVAGLLLALVNAPALNLLALGEDVATALGPNLAAHPLDSAWPRSRCSPARPPQPAGRSRSSGSSCRTSGRGVHRPGPPLAAARIRPRRRRAAARGRHHRPRRGPAGRAAGRASCWPWSARRSSSRWSGGGGWCSSDGRSRDLRPAGPARGSARAARRPVLGGLARRGWCWSRLVGLALLVLVRCAQHRARRLPAHRPGRAGRAAWAAATPRSGSSCWSCACRGRSPGCWSAPRWRLSGAITQTIARNPLASPDILGVTAGASAAAVA